MSETCLKLNDQASAENEGILLIDKPRGVTSFNLVARLRKRFGIKKIGHAGTLDPFATGVMVMLIGRAYTKKSDSFLTNDKAYATTIQLGQSTDTYDCEGVILTESTYVPTMEEVLDVLKRFQGKIQQIPPMFSAKKIDGKKLCDLARKGIEVERQPQTVDVDIEFISYTYPHLTLQIRCSKGTYIRSLGHDIGQALSCGAHLIQLQRTHSGSFMLKDCIKAEVINDPSFPIAQFLVKLT